MGKLAVYRAALWASVNAVIVPPATPGDQAFVREGGWEADYFANVIDGDPNAAAETVALVVREIEKIRRCYGLRIEPGSEQAGSSHFAPLDDPRWRLLKELYAVAYPGSSEWFPILVEPLLELYSDGIPGRQSIVVKLDHRLSLRSVIAYLRKKWPELHRDGIVRHTRPMDERTIALLRWICLEEREARSWPARWQAWNKKHRNKKSWKFHDTGQLTTAFHRAEKTLTGVNLGLAWYYNPVSRPSVRELASRLAVGDAKAGRELRSWSKKVARALEKKG